MCPAATGDAMAQVKWAIIAWPRARDLCNKIIWGEVLSLSLKIIVHPWTREDYGCNTPWLCVSAGLWIWCESRSKAKPRQWSQKTSSSRTNTFNAQCPRYCVCILISHEFNNYPNEFQKLLLSKNEDPASGTECELTFWSQNIIHWSSGNFAICDICVRSQHLPSC